MPGPLDPNSQQQIMAQMLGNPQLMQQVQAMGSGGGQGMMGAPPPPQGSMMNTAAPEPNAIGSTGGGSATRPSSSSSGYAREPSSMTTYVLRNGKMVEKYLAPQKPGSGVPYVISDEMPETRHMATNRHFTSKAAFRAETKAAGCIEVGNDAAITRPRKHVPLSREQRREDIKRTIYEMRNGRS